MEIANLNSSGLKADSLKNSGFRALVVDDYPAFQELLGLSLRAFPQIVEIDFADNGNSAINKAEATTYDLIFLDVMMPGIDGYETCTRLRENQTYKKTPIIMVSGKDSPFDEVKGIVSGCTTYVTKPIQQEAFQKLCDRVLTWLEFQKSNIVAG
jgi:two-component system, cell cycle response regulator